MVFAGSIASCQPKGTDNIESSDKTRADETTADQSVKAIHKGAFKYKGAYVGDNSAVGNILTRLPVSSYSKDFELSTVTEPYGVTVNYDGSESPQERPRIIVYTATYLMSLLRNADWVVFNFADQSFKLTKTQLQAWYGEDLSRYKNEDELNTLIEKNINDQDKINALLHQSS